MIMKNHPQVKVDLRLSNIIHVGMKQRIKTYWHVDMTFYVLIVYLLNQ